MTSIVLNGRAMASDLVNHTTEWGVAVSEANPEKTLGRKSLALVGYSGLAVASLLAIPILAGLTFFGLSQGILMEVGIVFAIVVVAKFLEIQSRKGPKNALQIDYDASEVRLGSIGPAGAFVRQKVCPLRSIDSARVETGGTAGPALVLEMPGETATLRFASADAGSLADLAARIEAAADAARAAPIGARIASRINGFEAGMREIGTRVRSRVQSRFA